MNKLFILYGAIILVVVVLAVVKFAGGNIIPSFGSSKATIGEHEYKVEVADSEEERVRGLSNRDSLGENNGMLFVFEEKDQYGFWMKDVAFPLDIIFINDNKIVDLVKNAPPQSEVEGALPIYTPKEDVNFVLELNGGQIDAKGIEIGQEIVIDR